MRGMADIFPPSRQRPALLAFAAALNSSPMALRRDECLDWRICGSSGHVYAVPGGFQFWCSTRSKRAWSAATGALSFAELTQDGDDEGVHFLDRLPTQSEGEALRRYLGIAKRREVSAETLARLALTRKPLVAGKGFRGEKLPSGSADGAQGPEASR
jgi:hypothetical protein